MRDHPQNKSQNLEGFTSAAVCGSGRVLGGGVASGDSWLSGWSARLGVNCRLRAGVGGGMTPAAGQAYGLCRSFPAWCGSPRRASCGGGAGPVAEAELGFAGLLRQLRAEARLTQEELAEAASLSPRSVSDLERGITPHRPQGHRACCWPMRWAWPSRCARCSSRRPAGTAPAAEVLAAVQGEAPGARRGGDPDPAARYRRLHRPRARAGAAAGGA